MPSRRTALIVLRIAVLLALMASAALLVDYVRPIAAFCEAGSGCEKVRASGFGFVPLGKLGRLPVPVIGLVGLAALFVSSLVPHRLARLGTVLMAWFGAVAALVFLGLMEFVIGSFCKLCIVVDTASLVAGLAAFVLFQKQGDEPTEPVVPWACAALLATLLPIGWANLSPTPPVPREIAELWRPGKINVVEFADFECPFCRKLHPVLTDAVRSYEGKVHLVRLNVPLAQHVRARDAARAYACAEDLGKGDAMADALFSAQDLAPEGCEKLAASLGIDPAAFRACVASAATEQKVEGQARRFKSAGLRGLPAVYVGERLLVGLQPSQAISDAFAVAAEGSQRRSGGLVIALFSMLSLGLLALVGYAARRTPG